MVGPDEYFAAYENAFALLAATSASLADIEDSIMRASGDPGKLVGQREPAASDMRRFGDPSVIGEPVVLTFSVRNPSARSARELASKIALPPEVTQADILDPDGLQVGHDSESPYRYSAKVDLAPGETRTFNVSVRNCWQIDAAARRGCRSRAAQHRLNPPPRPLCDTN